MIVVPRASSCVTISSKCQSQIDHFSGWTYLNDARILSSFSLNKRGLCPIEKLKSRTKKKKLNGWPMVEEG